MVQINFSLQGEYFICPTAILDHRLIVCWDYFCNDFLSTISYLKKLLSQIYVAPIPEELTKENHDGLN